MRGYLHNFHQNYRMKKRNGLAKKPKRFNNTYMTNTRRNFLQRLGLGTLALGISTTKVSAWPHAAVNMPLLLSTCDLGKQATAEAWKAVGARGRDLDAVEQGVRLTDADATALRLGDGGRLDRDGMVTRDECMMDEDSNIHFVAALQGIK